MTERAVRPEVVDVLGVSGPKGMRRSPLYLIRMIEKGFPTHALGRISSAIAPSDASFKYRLVRKATLARRKQRRRLSAEESERLARIARTWSVASEVWGSAEEAREFLFRPHQLLEGQRPIDVALSSDPGARLVEEILGRLQYGTAP
jgi:putative toxin-antitoxin system antitoxin component (TIGR02293 family)